MPVYKDEKRKTWYVKFQVRDAITEKPKQVLKRGFHRKADAVQWESEQRSNGLKRTSETLRDFANRYYDYNKPKERTRNSQLSMLERYAPELINLPIEKISKAKIMEWYLHFTSLDLKPGTMNLCIGVLRSIFKYANDHYDIPNYGVGLKRVKAPKKNYTTWTPDELETFLKHVDLEHYKNIYMFMYWTGCRRGEALALRLEDFDREKHTVHIHHQLQNYEDGFTSLKTESSVRTLKIPDALWARLEPVLEHCETDGPFVFGGSTSLPEASLQVNMEKAIKKAGVKRIRIHDLRHSFATNMIGSGANIVAVSKYLGHATVKQTLETYTHLLEKADDQMIQMINDLIPKSD